MEAYTVDSSAGTLTVQPLGTVVTNVNNEEYRVGIINGELCIWAPEVGPADSLVLVSELPNNWGGDDNDLEQLISEAKEMEDQT